MSSRAAPHFVPTPPIATLLSMALALIACAAPLTAQGRFRVLVPSLEAEGGAGRGFGRDVAEELRARIDDMDTHVSADPDEVRDAVRRHGLEEDELGCVEWRQLAVQLRVEIVFCGRYTEAGPERTVDATFQGARSGEPFRVPRFTTREAGDAAARIQSAFQEYVRQLRAAAICVEFVASGQWREAMSSCDAALAANPALVSALYARGRARLGLAGELAGDSAGDPGRREALLREALADFDAVLELNPVHEEALEGAGYAEAQREDWDAALAYYRRLLELDPGNVAVRLRLALDLSNNGDPTGALALVEEGIPRSPEDLSLKLYAGHFATAAAQRLQSLAAADTVAGPSPKPGVMGAGPGGFFEKAAAYYDTVHAAAPDSLDALTARNMLIAYEGAGRGSEVAEIGREALRRFPDDASLLLAMAGTLEKRGDVDEALSLLDRAEGLDPGATPHYAIAATWLLRAGRREDALGRLRRAVESGKAAGDEAARVVFAYAIQDPYKRKRWADAVPLLEAAADLARSPGERGRCHFFAGYALLQWGIGTEDGETAAAARRALPLFQRAHDHLTASAGSPDAERNDLPKLLAATRQYIDIQEALIKRGR